MNQNHKFYITTPIYYVNDKPHIGHAYTNIATDIIARFMRLSNREVMFTTGTDEHGNKIEKSAAAKGFKPQDFVDIIVPDFTKLTTILNISNNRFIRTTAESHKQTVINIWNMLMKAGYIYPGEYEGWYSTREEAFYDEDELLVHEQNKLSPFGSPVEWVKEESYFFALSKFQVKLLEFYQNNPGFIKPHFRYNEVINFVKSGLKDLSISRSKVNWGIPVPNRKSDSHQQTIYVWLDALSNYLSVIEYFSDKNTKNFWPADVHVIGKDILRFHAVYWPAFLMACDLPLPKCILTHGWWTNEGQKISKSIGNIIDPIELCEEFGVEPLRYYLLREVQFGTDGNFSRTNLIERINSDLGNKLGNLIQRVLAFIYKNFSGSISVSNEFIESSYKNDLLLLFCLQSRDKIIHCLDNYDLTKALENIFKLIDYSNLYINEKAPWKLYKENKLDATQNILYILVEAIRYIATLIQPFMPITAAKILKFLGINQVVMLAELDAKSALNRTISIAEPEILFQRIE